jgi:hypothetical protein
MKSDGNGMTLEITQSVMALGSTAADLACGQTLFARMIIKHVPLAFVPMANEGDLYTQVLNLPPKGRWIPPMVSKALILIASFYCVFKKKTNGVMSI